MKLRDHPLMNYRGNRSWPPDWLWKGGIESNRLEGEVGILKDVLLSSVPPSNTCFLIIEHCGAEYIGTILVSDSAFHRQICTVMLQQRGQTIRDIGEIDVSYTL